MGVRLEFLEIEGAQALEASSVIVFCLILVELGARCFVQLGISLFERIL